jgi:polyhydroxyalkanoate synthesis regulator phasin
MTDKAQLTDIRPVPDGAPPATVTPPPKRSPGHRGADVRDTVAEMAAKAQEISQEAGSKMAAAMKDVISAAAGLSGFAIESARDLVQYMVRRGQMTQEEADKLIREAEAADAKRNPHPVPPPSRVPKPPPPERTETTPFLGSIPGAVPPRAAAPAAPGSPARPDSAPHGGSHGVTHSGSHTAGSHGAPSAAHRAEVARPLAGRSDGPRPLAAAASKKPVAKASKKKAPAVAKPKTGSKSAPKKKVGTKR